MSNNLAAFLISVGAGLATSIGGVIIQFKSLHSLEFLSLSMGVAAGVMLHVSYVETMKQSLQAFESLWPKNSKLAMLVTNIMFFTGVLIVFLLGKAVDQFQERVLGVSKDAFEMPKGLTTFSQIRSQAARSSIHDVLAMYMTGWDYAAQPCDKNLSLKQIESNFVNTHLTNPLTNSNARALKDTDSAKGDDKFKLLTSKDKAKLLHTSIVTAVSVCAHNLPGGIASFIALSSGIGNGLPLTVALIIHNIPEGICVAVPILYATGCRTKAFLITLAAGLSKPMGAAIGWLLIQSIDPKTVNILYGSFFGMVAGLMIYIALVELIPTAYLYYPSRPGRVSLAIFVGVLAMELSIIIIELA